MWYASKLNSHVISAVAASQMQQVAMVVIVTVIEVMVTNLFHKQNVTVVHHLSNGCGVTCKYTQENLYA